MTKRQIVVDAAIFAHQEEDNIADMIRRVAEQTIFTNPEIDLRVHVLANGCRDATAIRAQDVVSAFEDNTAIRFSIEDLVKPGKSRTVEYFIHSAARPEADFLIFMDADIALPDAATLDKMVVQLRNRPELHVFVSKPVKDIVYENLNVGLIARLIAAGSDGLSDYRKSICGQLYAMRASAAHGIHLPSGLPAEDGFMRAMMLTDLLTAPGDLNRIDGDPDIFHVYESLRTIPALIQHQTRIVVGSSVNSAIYRRLRRLASTRVDADKLLTDAAADDEWLSRILKEELPRFPHGYVPFHFLTKRLFRFKLSLLKRPKSLLAFLAGVVLDFVAYWLATFRMIAGRGAGYW